jgi:prepilin-type N-terminal cleavage/methylation domain-containing protein
MKRRPQRGFSLVEVLIALAITSVVLLTVVSLFYMGRRNVYSGKQMTYGVSVATRVLEDLSPMTSDDIRSNFGIDDNTALTTVKVNGKSYDKSLLRDTKNISSSTDKSNYLQRWKDLVPADRLQDASVGLIITPTSPTNAGQPWSTAQYTKVRIYVTWKEAQRQRFAMFDTTKVTRPSVTTTS